MGGDGEGREGDEVLQRGGQRCGLGGVGPTLGGLNGRVSLVGAAPASWPGEHRAIGTPSVPASDGWAGGASDGGTGTARGRVFHPAKTRGIWEYQANESTVKLTVASSAGRFPLLEARGWCRPDRAMRTLAGGPPRCLLRCAQRSGGTLHRRVYFGDGNA